jgi:hypothetical protein
MAEQLERQLIGLIAADRLDVPISSMSGKLKRMKPKLARAIELPTGKYQGERVYARVEAEDRLKARTMSEAVDEFCTQYPKYGEALTQIIEDKRSISEIYLHFGMQEGCRLTADDYLGVMANLGFNESSARNLYGPLMETSRQITRKRDEERSILIG